MLFYFALPHKKVDEYFYGYAIKMLGVFCILGVIEMKNLRTMVVYIFLVNSES